MAQIPRIFSIYVVKKLRGRVVWALMNVFQEWGGQLGIFLEIVDWFISFMISSKIQVQHIFCSSISGCFMTAMFWAHQTCNILQTKRLPSLRSWFQIFKSLEDWVQSYLLFWINKLPLEVLKFKILKFCSLEEQALH